MSDLREIRSTQPIQGLKHEHQARHQKKKVKKKQNEEGESKTTKKGKVDEYI